ncbi:MFS transporter [Streptomyces sulfonofaciens]|uniref:MFS transporter n=1 Tax=Streptomyces sulfonofaciens TaxID=68272 RepID=A0A919G1Y4_9ACTN|nr:MFS transporter [Streptomyces sulfonofaciens]GHH75991.1 MFS transporter [Streptomyces sulfonofaciens]
MRGDTVGAAADGAGEAGADGSRAGAAARTGPAAGDRLPHQEDPAPRREAAPRSDGGAQAHATPRPGSTVQPGGPAREHDAAPPVGAPTAHAPSADAAARRSQQRGWYFYDWACSVYSTSVLTVFLGPYLTDVAKTAADAHGYVHPLGLTVRAGSFFAYCVSASVILAILVMPLAGAAADRTGRKKPLLGAAAYLGAAATAGMFFLDGDRYLLGGLLLIVANASVAVSMALYNSYLPQIALPEERDAVSSRGWAFGYASGSLVLLVDLGLFTAHDGFGVSQGTAVRICLATAGLWWGAFTLVPLSRLRDVPRGPARAAREAGGAVQGWRQLAATLGDMRRRPLTFAFLLAYLVYSDGIQTVISQASLYGAEELRLSQSTLITAVLLVQVLAVGGALGTGRLARAYGARRTILGSLVAWTATLAAGYFLPAGAPGWFYVLAVAIGLVLGGTQALSRSLFSHLVPRGKEAEYFAAYEMSDRGLAWVGPLIFGLTYQLSGSYRAAILSLVAFFVIGFALLTRVPVRRAIEAAGNPVPERI